MGQKMHPHGLRVGVIKDWDSKWYADKKKYSEYLVEDHKIREYVKKKLFISGISKIEIERTAKFVKVNVYTAKPGLVIGKGGNLAEVLKAELEKMIGKTVNLNIVEVKNIDLDAQLVAENNHNMDSRNLYISEIYANQGPTLKRIRPAAKGSAVRIRKRTSHITIVLKERD